MNSIDNEHWKDIDGYDGLYQVSDLGRVRSLKFGNVRVLRAYKDKDGYLKLYLYKDGKRKPFLVHRLVVQAFIPNYSDSKNEVNHINEVKTDNRATNLEWCDRQYNNTYNGLQRRRYHPQPIRNKIKELYRPDLTYADNLEILKANGIECCRDTIWKLRKDLNLIN